MPEDENTGSGWDRPSPDGEYGGSGQDTGGEGEGRAKRLKGSLFALVIGLMLLPVSFVLLYWNEGRAVDAMYALDRGSRAVVEADPGLVDPAFNGRLVHLSGTPRPVVPARDPSFNVSGDGLLRLTRTVEMYQWREDVESHGKGKESTYHYHLTWSEEAIDSGRFKAPDGHRNPPMPGRSDTFEAQDVRLNAFRVDGALIRQMTHFTPFRAQTPPSHGFQAVGDGFYRGRDPDQPVLGDTRIRFEAVPSQTVSIAAMQSGNLLTPYRDPNGHVIALIEPGVVTTAALFDDALELENVLTWFLRVTGFLAMLVGFLCLGRPLAAVFASVPFLESLVGAGLFVVALALAVPLTLLTVGVAWIAHRPLIGGGILAVAAGAWVLLSRGVGKRRGIPPAGM